MVNYPWLILALQFNGSSYFPRANLHTLRVALILFQEVLYFIPKTISYLFLVMRLEVLRSIRNMEKKLGMTSWKLPFHRGKGSIQS